MEFEKVKASMSETFATTDGDFNYKFEVSKEGKEVKSVTVHVSERTETGEKHIGYMSLNNGLKNTSFPLGVDVIPHIEVFEEFLESLKS